MEINDKIYCANSTPTFIPPRTVNFLINFNEFIRSMFCFGHCLCSFKNDVVAALFFFYIAVIVAVSRSLHCLLFSNTNYCVDVGSGVFATCIPFFAWLSFSFDNSVNNFSKSLYIQFIIIMMLMMIRLVWKFSYTHSTAHSTSSLFVFGFLLHRSIFSSTSCNLNKCKTVWKHFSQIIFKEMISIINSVHWTVMQKRFYVSRAAIASNKAKPCWTLSPWKYLYVLSFIQLSTLIIFQMNWICFRETFDAFNFGLFLSAKMRKYSSRNPLKRIRYQVSIIRFPPPCSARHGNSEMRRSKSNK